MYNFSDNKQLFADKVVKALSKENTLYQTGWVDPHPGRLAMKTRIVVKKWANEEDRLAGKEPMEVKVTEGNLGLNTGITRALQMMSISGSSAGLNWSNALSCIAVGDITTVESAAHTGLLAATSATAAEFHKMDATTYPGVSGSNLIFRSTFGSTEANFAWNEFVIKNATYNTDASGVGLIRKVSQQGTKISGQSWEATITITMS